MQLDSQLVCILDPVSTTLQKNDFFIKRFCLVLQYIYLNIFKSRYIFFTRKVIFCLFDEENMQELGKFMHIKQAQKSANGLRK